MRSKLFGLVAVIACVLSLKVNAALLVNPSFEQPVVPNPDFQFFFAGSTAITGWSIPTGSVDVLSTNWGAHQGNQSVDLSGVTRGGLYQDVATTPGKTYRLGFWFAGNPEFQGANKLKMMNLSWGGDPVATLSFDVTGKVKTDPGWTFYTYDLTATGPSTRLEFDSATNDSSGPLLDDVSLVEAPATVPLPPGALAGLAGAGTLCVARRRLRR